ncbi:hypothetical protein MMC22_002184 [Lobaria immixta]|nr:hypothetical protein [Lobaria immixta]
MLYLQEILGQVVLSFLFIRLTVAAATSGRFIDPPDKSDTFDTGPASTYTRGEVVQVTWQTNLSRIALTLWHSTSKDFEYLGKATENIPNTNSYPWLVDTKEDISENSFYFAIYDPGNTTVALSSKNFNIMDAPSASTGATVLSASVPTSIITMSASPTTMVLTSTYSVNQESSTATVTNTGISQGTKTGMSVGIGIGIGVPVLLAVGIYLGVVG